MKLNVSKHRVQILDLTTKLGELAARFLHFKNSTRTRLSRLERHCGLSHWGDEAPE